MVILSQQDKHRCESVCLLQLNRRENIQFVSTIRGKRRLLLQSPTRLLAYARCFSGSDTVEVLCCGQQRPEPAAEGTGSGGKAECPESNRSSSSCLICSVISLLFITAGHFAANQLQCVEEPEIEGRMIPFGEGLDPNQDILYSRVCFSMSSSSRVKLSSTDTARIS